MKPLYQVFHCLLVVLLVPILAFGDGKGEGHRAKRMISRLDLTEEQRDAIRPMRFELEKKLIDLNQKIAIARLELRQLLHAETLDQSSIARKMGDISQLRVQQKTLRLENWFEIQKLLTPDQQKSWKRLLQMKMAGNGGRREGAHHGPRERWREMMPQRGFEGRFD